MLSKNISSAMHPLPNHNIGKDKVKGVVFDKSKRFQKAAQDLIVRKEKAQKQKVEVVSNHYDPEKLESFGKGRRFKRSKVYEYPGPGEYKIANFAEKLVKSNEKIIFLKEQSIVLKKTELREKINSSNVSDKEHEINVESLNVSRDKSNGSINF